MSRVNCGLGVTQVFWSQLIQGLEDHCLDSLVISSSTVFHRFSLIKCPLGTSKLLFVSIMAARF